MTNNIPDRESVPIHKYEVAHTAFRQFDGCVSTASAQAYKQHRLVAEDGCFENASTTCSKRRLDIDKSNVN